MKPGSLIMADNTDFPGSPEYNEFVKARTAATSGLRFSSKTLFVEKESSGGSSRAVSDAWNSRTLDAIDEKKAIEATTVVSLP